MPAILFPVLVILASILAYAEPGPFLGLSYLIVPLLTVIMFSMGLSLTVGDFRHVLERPKAVGIGFLLQYTVMPLSGLGIATLFGLPLELLVGLVLVGCSPGGTASNVMAYLAKADVALSVTLTMVSSLCAVILTPGLVWLLVGQSVPVDITSMLLSVAEIVLIPVLLGVAINSIWGHHIDRLRHGLPYVAMAAIIVIIAIVVALNRDVLATAGLLIMLAVIAQNVTGLAAGYGFARLLGLRRMEARTISFEVGMQNSGLAVALAVQYFTPLAALPGAIFSVSHSLTGAALAGFWSHHRIKGEAAVAGQP